MVRNLGETKLRKRRSQSDPMRDFDRLPKLLRDWLNGAALPWRLKFLQHWSTLIQPVHYTVLSTLFKPF
ncbi:MAG: hypothetical protein EBW46_03595 [Rhodobacterales bacterium]|nr:hypothetical protein [Rhodobacterales bacterium]